MRRASVLIGLMVLVAIGFALSLAAGKVWVPLSACSSGDPRWWIIVELRLPRAILGLAIGAVLGLSGAVLQGYLRNPLADPALIGVSSSAGLGAVIAILLGLGGAPLILFGSAMAGAAASVLLLALLVGRSGSALAFILAGTVLQSLAGSLTAFLISIAPNPFAMNEVMNWMMGALTDRSLDDAMRSLPFMAVGCAVLATTGRSLDLLSLGEETARSLGVRAGRLQAAIALGTGLAVGSAVAVSGVVGFVGLIVPHLVRPLVGQRPSDVLLPSSLGGAALVLFADSLVRLAPGAEEIRLGIAMAVLGTPFFFALLLRFRRHHAWA
ncbi:FecCD family ABC transporter permease [Sphingomonas tabacisoli]|uniref:FecCD family ABC transporter permease n=1 Tax=Sphingomonas tabacisoli TaxID=2249466 RepID=A0ABW4I4I1_9SPHN